MKFGRLQMLEPAYLKTDFLRRGYTIKSIPEHIIFLHSNPKKYHNVSKIDELVSLFQFPLFDLVKKKYKLLY